MTACSTPAPRAWFIVRDSAVNPLDLIALFEACGYQRAAHPVQPKSGHEFIVRLVLNEANHVLIALHNPSVVAFGDDTRAILDDIYVVEAPR